MPTNTDRPRGMWPLRHLTGGEIRTSKYKVLTTNGNLITKGDPVIRETTGGAIDRAAATSVLLGASAGFEYKDANGDFHYSDQIPATKTNFSDLVAFVWDDPYIVFGIQSDGATDEDDVFNDSYLVVGAGNTTTKISLAELSDSNIGDGSSNLQILGKIDRPDNFWGANVDLEVVISNHAFKAFVTGV